MHSIPSSDVVRFLLLCIMNKFGLQKDQKSFHSREMREWVLFKIKDVTDQTYFYMLRESREITFIEVGILFQSKTLTLEVEKMRKHDIFAVSQAAYVRAVSE